jgi:hypothetical protein
MKQSIERAIATPLIGVMFCALNLFAGAVYAQSEKPIILFLWGNDSGHNHISAFQRGVWTYDTPNTERMKTNDREVTTKAVGFKDRAVWRNQKSSGNELVPIWFRSSRGNLWIHLGREQDGQAGKNPGIQQKLKWGGSEAGGTIFAVPVSRLQSTTAMTTRSANAAIWIKRDP